ncbi:hypothetical protein AOXY_G191 [Acipenser oxyrinchus oxyrinchus]|uniref:DDE Tnp4 domain-containing protein n=1 Tax=Acipenser oxyrinchus oxyrinchus TaxID=40147 RepID=A0AAD8LT98_ACIOX|nr:hypothetical protein AOXY_G191 [Acipenser oxyrinchus oxyrinchus]
MNSKQKKRIAIALLHRRKKNNVRSLWVHDILKRRKRYGEYHRLIQELRFDGGRFQTYFRLDHAQFDYLLSKIGPTVTRMGTNYREAQQSTWQYDSGEFLATGDSYRTIAFSYRVGVSTVAGIVIEVCKAIWDSLVSEYMRVPNKEDWETISREYEHRWNFPNCLGAIHGKHVVIQAPASSGSQYYNYKGRYSIVLLAVVDANYCFTIIDVGAFGRNSDGGTLANSALGKALKERKLTIPDNTTLPAADHLGPGPHVIVGDEAFPRRKNLMRPYPPGRNLPNDKHIFNYC